MSLRGIFEFVIKIDRFRNVDLFHQGLYHLRFRIYHEVNGEVYLAHPYSIISPSQKKSKNAHNLIPAGTVDAVSAFQTKSFLIRYQDEEVQINDIAHFRTEIDIQDNYLFQSFIFEVELMWTDLSNIGGLELWKYQMNQIESKAEFKSVSTRKFRLNNSYTGIHEYAPILFDELHYCMVCTSIHSVLLDFKFRSKPLLSVEDESASTLTYIDPSEKDKDKNGSEKRLTKNSENRKKYKNLTEFFFARESQADMTGLEVDDKDINAIFQDFIQPLITSYERLHAMHSRFIIEGLSEQQRVNIAASAEVEPFINFKADLAKPRSSQDSSWIIDTSASTNADSLISSEKAVINKDESSSDEEKEDVLLKENSVKEGESEEEVIDSQKSKQMVEENEEEKVQKRENNNEVIESSTLDELNDASVQEGQYCSKFPFRDPEELAKAIQYEMNNLAANIFQLWHKLVMVLQMEKTELNAILKESFKEKMRESWGESIFRNIIQTSDYSLQTDKDIGQLHKHMAKVRRNNVYYLSMEPLKVEDINLIPDIEQHPIVFEDVYLKSDPKDGNQANAESLIPNHESFKKDYDGIHLFILVHGFQGNPFDMRLIKNNISTLYPDSVFMCASSNEGLTDDDIHNQGLRLSEEVQGYIAEWCPTGNLAKLSFIGHSMGGLVIRSALPHLQEYSDKMHLYMTLSSPHLGYMFNSGKLVNAGLWVLKKWKKSQSLQQLMMTDEKDPKDTFLFKASKLEGLTWFKHVALISSFQDSYAPYESARIEICKNAANDPSRGSAYIEMARNLLHDMELQVLYRIDVNFKIKTKNLDNFIGRTAHIRFLEDQSLMQMILTRYTDFFR
eukprot:CAMPEP_0115014822 /NCGR_PEP_ID=MMETSP0216-20121206/26337_1 /TAXON_ID=223996 /ORGANISM="Protocruzia adherens, Strain Boccale" /LENGTH=844 /DNA_ID=CAMNT_0002384695 /DNA_START=9 /DNA_END=2543 /DNA_ORIENTATION=-